LARSVGRLDFDNVYYEMSPFEWSVHQALAVIEPWGEDRADLRAAVNTVRHLIANSNEPSEDAIEEELRSLSGYLRINRPPERILSPAEAAAAINNR